MNSIWVEIPDYPNYRVSPEGNILSLNYNKTGKPRLLAKNKRLSSYVEVQLRNKNGVKHTRVHRVVADIFCKKQKHHTQVNHKDRDGQNNHFLNLEWCTSSENIQHSYDTNKQRGTNANKIRGACNGRAKLSEQDALFILNYDCTKYGTKAMLSKKFKVSKTVIFNIKSRKIWKHLTGEL